LVYRSLARRELGGGGWGFAFSEGRLQGRQPAAWTASDRFRNLVHQITQSGAVTTGCRLLAQIGTGFRVSQTASEPSQQARLDGIDAFSYRWVGRQERREFHSGGFAKAHVVHVAGVACGVQVP